MKTIHVYFLTKRKNNPCVHLQYNLKCHIKFCTVKYVSREYICNCDSREYICNSAL